MAPYFKVVIPTYMLLSTVGIFFGAFFLYSRLPKFNFSFLELLKHAAWGSVGLLVGSKVLFSISAIPKLNSNFDLGIFFHHFFQGGIVFYGGLLGMISFIYLRLKWKCENIINFFDFLTPAIPLFHIWGRLGCFFGGCCYGIPFPWGFAMFNSPGVIRFPVQLVESFCNLILFIILSLNEKYQWLKNNLRIYLLGYSSCRFFLEMFRGDEVRGIWYFLSTSQIISIVIFIACIINIYKERKLRKKVQSEGLL